MAKKAPFFGVRFKGEGTRIVFGITNKQRKKNKRRLWTALVEDYRKINKVGKVFKVFKELKDIYGF